MMSKLIFTPYGYPKQPDNYLAPTKFLDFEDPIVRSFTEKAIDGQKTDLEKAVALFTQYVIKFATTHSALNFRKNISLLRMLYGMAPPFVFQKLYY